MTNIHWLNPVSGDFNTGTNWSGGTVPGASDNAFIDAAGAPYTVTDSSTAVDYVGSLQVAANVTFDVGYGGNFQVLNGGANSGTIEAPTGRSVFSINAGTFANKGTISLSHDGALLLGESTLDGGGQVTMDGFINLYGSCVNLDNTISGAGGIGLGPAGATLTNGAAGVINANGVGGALLISNDSITNNGLIESTGVGANLFLDIRRGANVDQTGGGTILAANGAVVYLEQVSISGGTLTSVGTGVIDIAVGNSNTVLDGSASPLIDKATINVFAGYITGSHEATLKGAIVNSGVINVAGAGESGNQTNLIVDPAGVTLTGAGSINLVAGVATQRGAGTAQIVGAGAGSVLTNVDNTIAGTGGIGAGGLTVINQGVIDANAAKALFVVDSVVNSGLIEATVGALVAAGTITNAGGTIEANGGRVLLNGVDIAGGTVEAVGSSHLTTEGLGTVLDGTGQAVTLAGTLTVAAATNLTLEGAIDNPGRIAVNSSTAHAGNTDLIVGAAGAALSGGGQIVLTALGTNRIYGVVKGATLDNIDNRISGAGLLGNGVLTLVNGAKGVIVANSSVGLTLNTGSNTIDNAGVIYTSGSGLMVIDSAIANNGVLSTHGGLLKVNGAVSGAGRAVVTGGLLDFTSSFSQNVWFGAAGTLELGQSHLYGGELINFSKIGRNSLDLADIAGGVASYNGTANKGVLTVTGGGVSAHFTLIGDYLGTTFAASSDGHGGTKVVDTGGAAATVAPATHAHAFIAAMAGLGAGAGAAIHTSGAFSQHPPILVKPHTMIA
ncbi:MAG: hypothetical protein M3T55_07565 [Pseudomonadota bacterium]|nr:hypothetical protein [Pseudomonadota bacterium]